MKEEYKYAVEIALDTDNVKNPWITVELSINKKVLEGLRYVEKNIGFPIYLAKVSRDRLGTYSKYKVSYLSLKGIIDIKKFLNDKTIIYRSLDILEGIFIDELYKRQIINTSTSIVDTLVSLDKIRIIYTKEKY